MELANRDGEIAGDLIEVCLRYYLSLGLDNEKITEVINKLQKMRSN